MTSMTSGRRVVNGVIGSPDLAGSGQRSLVSVSDIDDVRPPSCKRGHRVTGFGWVGSKVTG